MNYPLIIIQNSEIEKPGLILEWAKQRKIATRIVRAFENEPFPIIDDVEMVIVLDAPVRVGDDLDWLKNERAWLRRIVARDTLVLGLSFGAQLLADVLGAKVWPAPAAEIGWHEVKFTSFNLAENIAVLFQWRDEEFSLPEGARILAKSRAGAHHAFQKNFVTGVKVATRPLCKNPKKCALASKVTAWPPQNSHSTSWIFGPRGSFIRKHL